MTYILTKSWDTSIGGLSYRKGEEVNISRSLSNNTEFFRIQKVGSPHFNGVLAEDLRGKISDKDYFKVMFSS